jgi:hypothetical protein
MKRRVCSYDMFAVPDPSFVLKDKVEKCTSAICDASASGRCSWLHGRTFLKKIKRVPIR